MKLNNIILASAFAILLSSCSGHDEEVLNIAPEEQIPEPIDICFGGVGTETRALEGSYMYAINVWLDRDKNGKYDASDFYAKGLFSSLTGVRLTTYPGYSLKFECTIVKDATEKIASTVSNGQRTFKLPLSSVCTNSFSYSTASTTLSPNNQLTSGLNLASEATTVEELYYGILADFTPFTSGEKAIIPVKRMNYGYRIIVEGIEEGTASLKVGGSTIKTGITSNYTSPDEIKYISESSASSAFNMSGLWTTTLNLTVDYVSDRQAITGDTYWNKSISKTATLTRTKFSNIKIKMSGYDKSSATFDFELEEKDFEEEIVNITMQVDKNDHGSVSN